MGKKWKQWHILFSWGPKSLWTVTSARITRHLLHESKAVANLDSILKSRSTLLLTKVHIVKGMVFPEVVCRCESWTIKKAEHQRIDVFQLWYWRRFLRVPWAVRRSNQSILMEMSPEYSLEGLMLKLKLQYFGHLVWKANSLEKSVPDSECTSDSGKDWGQEKNGATEDETVKWHHWLNGHEFEQTVRDNEGQGTEVHGVEKVRHNLENSAITTSSRYKIWLTYIEIKCLFHLTGY